MDISNNVSAKNPVHIPMTKTDYCRWLLENNISNVDAIYTKREYLKNRFGFIRGLDTVDLGVIATLKHIENFYFDFYVMSKPRKPFE